jgi:hypothetical protein
MMAEIGQMTDDAQKKSLLKAAEIEAMAATRIRHPLNPASEVHLRPLSDVAGMHRVRLTLARIPPGKESFAGARRSATRRSRSALAISWAFRPPRSPIT